MELSPLIAKFKELGPLLTVLGAIAGAALGATLVHMYTQNREAKQRIEREKKIAYQMLIRVGWVVALKDILPIFLKIHIPDSFIEDVKAKTTENFEVSHWLSCVFEEYITENRKKLEDATEREMLLRIASMITERIRSSKIVLDDIMSITTFPQRIALVNDKYNSLLDDAVGTVVGVQLSLESQSINMFTAKDMHSVHRMWQDIQQTAEDYLKEILQSGLVLDTEYKYILAKHKSDIVKRLLRNQNDQESIVKAKEAIAKEKAQEKAQSESPSDPLAQP